MKIYAVTDGLAKAIEKVNDAMFAQKMLGDGIVIEPSCDDIVSPCDGEVIMAYPTGHAYGLKSKDGVEILIHLGIDTVELTGKYFFPKVKIGDKVSKGDLIVSMDHQAIKKEGYIDDVILICTSSKINVVKNSGIVNREEIVFETVDGEKDDSK